MRIIHTIASTLPEHGGTSRSVPALCEALSDAMIAARAAQHTRAEVHLVTGIRSGRACRIPAEPVIFHGVEEPRVLGRLRVGTRFLRQLESLIVPSQVPVILHDHGIWLGSNHASAVAARRSKAIRVVAPRGMLSPWSMANSAIRKAIPWRLYQYRDLLEATAFHATSELEADEIRALGFRQPIAVIPNGVEVKSTKTTARGGDQVRTMLFLSRVHPKKGLINLLEAWKMAKFPDDWKLVIAGPDEGKHLEQVLKRAEELGLRSSVEYAGEFDDVEKWRMYASSSVFVLPSFSENFGIVVAEALISGVPVLTTTGTPWKDLESRGCGWCVEPSVDSLSRALRRIAEMSPDELSRMGECGRSWVGATFSWPAIGRQMLRFYDWLLNSGEMPEFVRWRH